MVNFKYSDGQKGPRIQIARYAYFHQQWFNDHWLNQMYSKHMRLDQSQVNKLIPFKCLAKTIIISRKYRMNESHPFEWTKTVSREKNRQTWIRILGRSTWTQFSWFCCPVHTAWTNFFKSFLTESLPLVLFVHSLDLNKNWSNIGHELE